MSFIYSYHTLSIVIYFVTFLCRNGVIHPGLHHQYNTHNKFNKTLTLCSFNRIGRQSCWLWIIRCYEQKKHKLRAVAHFVSPVNNVKKKREQKYQFWQKTGVHLLLLASLFNLVPIFFVTTALNKH